MKFTYTGLSEQEVRDSRNQHGSNAVTTQNVETFWDKLIANLKDPIIMILIVALLVTLALAALGFAPWYEGLGNRDSGRFGNVGSYFFRIQQ